MSEQGNSEFKEFIVRILDASATRLAEMGEPMTAEALSVLVIERLTTPEMKSTFAQAIQPLVQAWLDGRHQG
jgi:hypothetical protein